MVARAYIWQRTFGRVHHAFAEHGESAMTFRNMPDPERRAILTAVLDDVCAAAGIEPQSQEGEEAADLILHLYGCGYQTADGLKAMFDGQTEEAKQYG
jgi:hypothetical protein